MKTIVVVAVALCLGVVGVLGFSGCGARVEVAKEKMLKQIDYFLGETDVQKKEVQIALQNMDKAVDSLTRGRITATVQVERLERQAKESEQSIADTDGSLRKIREYLLSEHPVQIAGKEYTNDKLKEMAEKVIQVRKGQTEQKESLKRSQDRLQNVVHSLTKKEEMAKEKIGKMKSQLREIEIEMIAMNAFKDAAKAAGDGDKTFGDNFKEMERKVAALHDKVKTETRFEEERWQTQQETKEVDSVEQFIARTKSDRDTLAEIDKILGKK
jgi:chromosome segregation ATPase